MALQATWFFLWGLLWAIFFITDGFDFGVGTLYPFLGKTETDKRIMINALGPLWDGNEVWLITAGGVTFAAFPPVYATMFSTLYSPLMLILFALILLVHSQRALQHAHQEAILAIADLRGRFFEHSRQTSCLFLQLFEALPAPSRLVAVHLG